MSDILEENARLKEENARLNEENNQLRNRETVRLAQNDVIYCSFCPNSNKNTEFMISGMYGNICNVCLDLCIDVKKRRKNIAANKS